VAEPAPDDIDLDTGLKQVHRRRVTEDVRPDPTVASLEAACVSAHELVDAEAGQRLSVTRLEHRTVRDTRTAEQFTELPCRLCLERAGPPLVTLAMESRTRRRCEVEIAHPKVDRLLDTRTRVVQEQQQNPIAQRVPASRRNGGEKVSVHGVSACAPWRTV